MRRAENETDTPVAILPRSPDRLDPVSLPNPASQAWGPERERGKQPFAQLLEVRVFYFHLREECQADADRVHRVKQRLARMRHQVYELREQLSHCSPLGGLLRGVRGLSQGQDGAVVRAGTLRRIEAAGYRSLREVATLDIPALTALGVRPVFAKQIRRYLQRRPQ